jgi:hypothetical protein
VSARARFKRLWPTLWMGWALPLAAASPGQSACSYLAGLVQGQPGTALFLASYPSAGPGPLQNAAFLYDNAVAAIALVGCGQRAQARRIGEAMLWALDHDRYWHDGRLRNAYLAGSIDGKALKLAGWWDASAARWLEDGYQAGSDTGNMAWAMLALLTLDAPGDERFRRGAARIAQWVAGMSDGRGAGGFTGGSFGHEPAPQRLSWKSTEHNTDLAATFVRLAEATGEPHWAELGQSAAHFVDAMWDAQRGSFAVGTLADGQSVNPMLALDAQVWPLLALPDAASRYGAALPRVLAQLRSGDGYAYSDAGGGPWTEGGAQVMVLLKRLHQDAQLPAIEAGIAAARAPDGGYYATTLAAVPTGFMLATDPDKPRLYLHLEHLGATAWAALAEQGFNPFTGARTLPHSAGSN